MNNKYPNTNHTSTNNTSGDVVSWVVVIICLIAFWPVGLILLLRKISFNAKKSASFNSNCRPGQTSSQAQQGSQSSQQGPQANQTHYKPPQASRQTYQPYRTPQTPKTTTTSNQTSYTQQQGAYTAQPVQQVQKTSVKKTKIEKEKKQPGKGLAAFLTFLGVLFSVIGVACVASGANISVTAGMDSSALATLLIGIFFCLGGVISFLSRIGITTRIRRWNKYSAILGDREVMSVEDMSRSSGVAPKKLRKELTEIAEYGYFGDSAFFDSGLDSLVLSCDAADKARQVRETAKTAVKEGPAGSENQYVAIINELHMLGCNTSDPTICAKITRIEVVTAKIFKIVEDKPEKVPQIRRFMNYYLPTTMKLLNSYVTLEKQGINGENIMSAKQDIERVLETLATGFEQQLDNLFKSDKIDISADIDVLENMMEQDGLTSENNMFKTAGGN